MRSSLQYWPNSANTCWEKTTDEAFDRAQAEVPSGRAAYDAASFSYGAQSFFYRVKFILVLAAAMTLVIVLGLSRLK
jgi:hypothetical protein